MSDLVSPEGAFETLRRHAADSAESAVDRAAPISPWYAWAMVLLFEATMLIALPALIGGRRWGQLVLTGIVMVSVAAPTAARPLMPTKLPVGLEMGIAGFVFATLFLGEVADFYTRLPWWDLALHGSSGVLFSAVGLLLAYALQRRHAGDAPLAPRLAYLFAPMFAMSIGTFWELFEFTLQSFSGLPIQAPRLSDGSDIVDTMSDMMMNAAGAIAVAAYGWHAARPGRVAGMPRWVARFLARNPAFPNGGP